MSKDVGKRWRWGKDITDKQKKDWADEAKGWRKVYGVKEKKKLTFKDETKKPEHLGDRGSPRPAHLGDRGFKLKFGDAFRIAKKAGKDTFTWKGKSYHTKSKSELEKATTKSKSKREERFDPTKIKAAPKKKKSWIKTFGESKTLKEFAKKMKARKS